MSGDPEASDQVRFEWARRVAAEYHSCAVTQQLTLWLTQIGASPDLVREGLAIAEDELTHAQMAHQVLAAAGGALTEPLDRATLGLRRRAGEPLELDVLRHGVRIFCLGETVAVPLFARLRDSCTVGVARRALDKVLRDEVRHRDFGWALLGWMLEALDPGPLVECVEAELPGMVEELRGAYGDPLATVTGAGFEASDRAWGLMPAAEYAAVLERTVTRDYLPRFAELGVDAAGAFES